MIKARTYFTDKNPEDINDLETENLLVTNSATVRSFSVSGSANLETVGSKNLAVTGVSTFSSTEITNAEVQNVNVTGISTLGITSSNSLESKSLLVTGISTLGFTTITNLISQNLSVGGITTTNSLQSQNINILGNSLTAGITTVGLGTTSSPSNSQLTFELANNTTLRVRVRGTDGVVRTGIVTLS